MALTRRTFLAGSAAASVVGLAACAEAQASINGTTGLVVIGRGGGGGGDLSRDLKSGVSKNFTANAEMANYADGQHELQLTVDGEGPHRRDQGCMRQGGYDHQRLPCR